MIWTSAVAVALAWTGSACSSCWRKKSSRRLMITGVIRPSVTATTATKAIVRRLWNERGTDGLGARTPRRRCSCCGVSASEPPVSPAVDARGSPMSAPGELVAGAPDRQHEPRQRRVVLDLLAQVAHVDVDRLLKS